MLTVIPARGEQQAGFYWIELRDDTLHLHGLILKDTFHNPRSNGGTGVFVFYEASTR